MRDLVNVWDVRKWQIWGCYTNYLSGKALVGAYMHMMIYDVLAFLILICF